MKKNWKLALLICLIIFSGITVIKVTHLKSGSTPDDQNAKHNPSNQNTPGVMNGSKEGEATNANNTAQTGTDHGATLDRAQTGDTNHPVGAAPMEPPVGAVAVATVPTVEKKTEEPEKNCFTVEYHHQKSAQAKDLEDFLDYSNAFPIAHEKYNPNTVCVKVNQQPVKFKIAKYKGQTEVVVGSEVGPDSVIKVSYCVGKVTCKEKCEAKPARFMDDLMADSGEDDEFKDSWGDSKEQKKELQAKVKEFRTVANETNDLTKRSTMRDWDTINKQEWFCKK